MPASEQNRLRDASEIGDEWRQRATEYMPYLAGDIVRAYGEFGLAVEFQAILGRHLSDLRIEIEPGLDQSHLTVTKSRPPEGGQPQWGRELSISSTQLRQYRNGLNGSLDSIVPNTFSQPVINKLAFDWTVFELTADALGNSVAMQEKFDKYVPDYNGQSRHYRSELSVTRRYLESELDIAVKPIDVKLLESHHNNFKAGIGLAFLKDALLLYGISREQQAQWVIESLKNTFAGYQAHFEREKIDPLNDANLSACISILRPYDTRRALAEFVMGLESDSE